MKDPEAPRTGIIECEKGSASFYMNDFSFCFMNNTIKRITKRSGEIYSAANLLFALKKQGNFYVGVTNDNQSIAIYAKDCPTETLVPKWNFRTSTYIVQDAIVTEKYGYSFDSIELKGGILNSLFRPEHIPVDYSDSGYTIKDESFERQGLLNWNGQEVTVKLGWYTITSGQPRKFEVRTSDLYFRFEFSNPVNLDEALFHVEKARELMSFLSYRKNVEFNSVTFQRKQSIPGCDLDSNIYYSDDAHVYINYGFESTQKDSFRCICFDDIKDAVFSLLAMFYDCSDYNPIKHLSFIPENDKHANLLSPTDIREIATLLECETKCACRERDEKSKVLYDESQRLSTLLSKIKQVISEDESENGPLPGSIQSQFTKRFYKASLPSKHKDILLYNAYKNIIGSIAPYYGKVIDENDINDFRNYRNKETHGNYNLLNLNVGITAMHLVVAVYCSILHRSGVDDQILTTLCERKFFS